MAEGEGISPSLAAPEIRNRTMTLEPTPKSQEQITAEIAALVERLNSRNKTVFNDAVQKLTHLDEISVEILLTLLKAQNQRDKRLFRGGVFLFFFINFGLSSLPWGNSSQRATLGTLFAFAFFILLYGFMERKNHLLKFLSRVNDVRFVGVLTDALSHSHKPTRIAVRNALIRLLPRVKHSDTKYLTLERRKILMRQFEMGDYHLPLLHAIIKGMEQTGGEEAIPAISRVASGHSLASKYPRMKEAAQECLPYLQARAAGKELRDTLLRASHDTTVEQTLLRTSESATPEEERQLLRPQTMPPRTGETDLE